MSVRPIEPGDLEYVAALYADLIGCSGVEVPGVVDFFNRTLLESPLADPEIPALVYDDPADGVIGVIGSHVRPFLYRDRPVRLAHLGPVIVSSRHRRQGIGAKLLGRYLKGPQEMTVNDRSLDATRILWSGLGGIVYQAPSIGWARVLAPVGMVGHAVSRRALKRSRPPGGAALALLDKVAVGRLNPSPERGSVEPLSSLALLDLIARLEPHFPLRPAYDEAYLARLIDTMERVDIGDGLVRRLVRDDDGRPLGAYMMYVTVHAKADVVYLAAAESDAGLVLDHLFHDAACLGAVDIRGRMESFLAPHLRTRRCRLTTSDWVILQPGDPELVTAVLSGRALLTRMDGEWWMRPHREMPPSPGGSGRGGRLSQVVRAA
jgi:GNAT superfamily N-acetyltransferase